MDLWFDNLWTFIQFGFQHILPDGPDHVLFVIALYLSARTLNGLILQVTVFTLAHTITLALTSLGVISAPASLVEPMIALSIAVVAIEALIGINRAAWRLPVVFAFGLFHGLGFGETMRPILQTAEFSSGLAGITVGVEAGHLTVLFTAALIGTAVKLALTRLGKEPLYQNAFIRPVAGIIALIGLYWTLQRVGALPGG